jgi:hypothetical protein
MRSLVVLEGKDDGAEVGEELFHGGELNVELVGLEVDAGAG